MSKRTVNVFLISGIQPPSIMTTTIIEESEMYQPYLNLLVPSPEKYSIEDTQKSGQIKTKNTQESTYTVDKWEFFPKTKTCNVYVNTLND